MAQVRETSESFLAHPALWLLSPVFPSAHYTTLTLPFPAPWPPLESFPDKLLVCGLTSLPLVTPRDLEMEESGEAA